MSESEALELVLGPPRANDGPQRLHGVSGPRVLLQQEQPWHRAALYLFVNKRTKKDIAKIVERSVDEVSLLFKQPWFQAKLTELLDREGVDILDLFRAHALEALTVVVDIMHDEKAGKRDRLAAAFDILNRAPNVGKPVTRVENGRPGEFSSDPVAEAARLEAENAKRRDDLAKFSPGVN